MTSRLRLVAAVILGAGVVAAAARPASAQTVAGEVIDCTGRVQRGVKVELVRITTPGGTRTAATERSMDTDQGGEFAFPQGGGTLDGGTFFVRITCPRSQGGGPLQSQDFYLSPAYRTDNTIFLRFICCPTLADRRVLVRRDEIDNGVLKRSFETFEGAVSMFLPAGGARGRISGVVLAEPKGDTDEQRAKNRATLSGLVVQIDGAQATVPDTDDKRPPVLEFTTASVKMPPQPPGAGPPGPPGIFVQLKDKLGDLKGIGPIFITPTIVDPAAGDLAGAAPDPGAYRFPEVGQVGRQSVITCARPGCFDGTLATTNLSLRDTTGKTIDLTERILVESPDLLAFKNPDDFVGPGELTLQERTVQTSAPYRCAGVDLGLDGSTTLNRGERRTMQVKVSGLAGLQKPVPMYLEKTGVVSMEGGANQIVQIPPREVRQDGTYVTTRRLTGERAGGFTARVDLVLLDVCLQEPKGGNTLLFSSQTGDYFFCSRDGATVRGAGQVSKKGSVISLERAGADRRVIASLDPTSRRGTATVQILGDKKKSFTIQETDTSAAGCSCGAR